MLRARRLPPKDIFPVDPWAFEAVRFERDLAERWVGQNETLFALSNGFIGLRGAWDEGQPAEEPAVYVNGLYETRPIVYGESAYGFPRHGQSMINAPDGAIMRLFVDDQPFVLTEAEVTDFRRRLDFRRGLLERDVAWRTRAGKRMRLVTRRFVSTADRHLMALEWRLTAEDAASVTLASELTLHPPLPTDAFDPRLAELAGRVLVPEGAEHSARRAALSFTTEGSKLTLGCGMDHEVETDAPVELRMRCVEAAATLTADAEMAPGATLTVRKFVAYHYDGGEAGEMRDRVNRTLDRAGRLGFERALERHEARVAAFWDRADIRAETDDPQDQQIVRWNLFQLMQASERSEGHGVGARGLTGRSYEGHYFWDTEIYVLPFLVFTNPAIARSLLKFRYDMLDQARERAAELGHKGATFPWRTINGREASAYYAAGTAQYHINADIAYALCKYVDVTGDHGFMREFGAELLVETARLWRDLGFFSERRGGAFLINGVTGPDEYNAVVNNNYFTNLMAQENLRCAAAAVEALDPEALASLRRRTRLDMAELEGWRAAADRMWLPYDERLGVHPQDDAFLDKERWDFENTPEEMYPLLLHVHPLNLYRAQVIKQADTVLAMFLQNDRFSLEEKKRNFDYYDPLTTHDSSLSVCIQSIVANEIGYAGKAREYFDFAAAMDLSDVGGNMRNGAHVASIGGAWMALAYGFAGLRDDGGRIRFGPNLPPGWNRLRMTFAFHGGCLRLDADRERTRYTLLSGERLSFGHLGEALTLTPDAPEAERRSNCG